MEIMTFFKLSVSCRQALLAPAILLCGQLIGGCQSATTDERDNVDMPQQDYNLASMNADDIKSALNIGLSEEEVLKKWGEPEQRKPSETDKNKTTWYYTRVVHVTRYETREKQDAKTGETIYVEEPVVVVLEHVSRVAVFVDGKLESWRIYPAGLTPDMSRAKPYQVEPGEGTSSP
jgi:hypothetical protein